MAASESTPQQHMGEKEQSPISSRLGGSGKLHLLRTGKGRSGSSLNSGIKTFPALFPTEQAYRKGYFPPSMLRRLSILYHTDVLLSKMGFDGVTLESCGVMLSLIFTKVECREIFNLLAFNTLTIYNLYKICISWQVGESFI